MTPESIGPEIRIPLHAVIGIHGIQEQWYWQCRICACQDTPDDSYGWTNSPSNAETHAIQHIVSVHKGIRLP